MSRVRVRFVERALMSTMPLWVAFSVAVISATAIGFVIESKAADAHSTTIRYLYPWAEGDGNNEVDWRFGDLQDLDYSGTRNRVRTVLNRWESKTSGLTFNERTEQPSQSWTPSWCAFSEDAWVFGRDIPTSGLLAETAACITGSPARIDVATMSFEHDDPAEVDWNRGTDNPKPGEWDLFSIAAHEAGHLTGWFYVSGGHLAEWETWCPETNARSTMCVGNSVVKGTKWLRTLEHHDEHTIANEYG